MEDSALGAFFRVGPLEGQSWWKEPTYMEPQAGQMRDVDSMPGSRPSWGSEEPDLWMLSDTPEL